MGYRKFLFLVGLLGVLASPPPLLWVLASHPHYLLGVLVGVLASPPPFLGVFASPPRYSLGTLEVLASSPLYLFVLGVWKSPSLRMHLYMAKCLVNYCCLPPLLKNASEIW